MLLTACGKKKHPIYITIVSLIMRCFIGLISILVVGHVGILSFGPLLLLYVLASLKETNDFSYEVEASICLHTNHTDFQFFLVLADSLLSSPPYS